MFQAKIHFEFPVFANMKFLYTRTGWVFDNTWNYSVIAYLTLWVFVLHVYVVQY